MSNGHNYRTPCAFHLRKASQISGQPSSVLNVLVPPRAKKNAENTYIQKRELMRSASKRDKGRKHKQNRETVENSVKKEP